MYIPDFVNISDLFSSEQLCPSRILNAFDKRDAISTAESFKSWDTCMDNKTCKIVAIVGIVLACLFIFWVLSTVFQMICCGLELTAAICCCLGSCCCCGDRHRHEKQQVVVVRRDQPPPMNMSSRGNAYNNPHMYQNHHHHHHNDPFDNRNRY